MKFSHVLIAGALVVSGCAVSPKSFYEAPEKVKVTNLCRALFEAEQKYDQQQFANDLRAELERRGVGRQECTDTVNTENAVLALTAVAATGVAVASPVRMAAQAAADTSPRMFPTTWIAMAGVETVHGGSTRVSG